MPDDPTTPLPQDDLTGLERRLSGWTPSAPAWGRDRMLFEAGRASARAEARGRLATALAAGLAALAVGLGGWAVREHTQRRALESALAERSHALEDTLAGQFPPSSASPVAVPEPESYLALTRRLAIAGPGEPETLPAPPVGDRRPDGPGRALTPLSALRPGGLMDL